MVSLDARNRKHHIKLYAIRIRIRRESRKYLSFTLTKILDVAIDMLALGERIWPPLRFVVTGIFYELVSRGGK